MIDVTRMADEWRMISQNLRKELPKEEILPPQREALMGLKYRKGQRVVDKITGKEVEIIGGKREIVAFRPPRGD